MNVVRPDGLAVAVAVHNGDISPEEAEANAHLIAAAPDLLVFARMAVQLIQELPEGAWSTDERILVGGAEAAIAKAEGRI